MISVTCKTNLDLANEQWPTELPAVPGVGDKIQSATVWGVVFQLQLEVVSVTWKQHSDGVENWYPEIELHIRKAYKMTITDFYEWYAPKVGRSVSAFI